MLDQPLSEQQKEAIRRIQKRQKMQEKQNKTSAIIEKKGTVPEPQPSQEPSLPIKTPHPAKKLLPHLFLLLIGILGVIFWFLVKPAQENRNVISDVAYQILVNSVVYDKKSAKDRVSELENHGFEAYILENTNMATYKIFVGPHQSKEEAETTSNELNNFGYQTYIDKAVYTVQIAYFFVETNAKRLASELEDYGYKMYIIEYYNKYKVQVGEYKTYDEAENTSRKLENLGHDTWVTNR